MKKKTFRLKTMWFHVTHMKPHGFSWKTITTTIPARTLTATTFLRAIARAPAFGMPHVGIHLGTHGERDSEKQNVPEPR